MNKALHQLCAAAFLAGVCAAFAALAAKSHTHGVAALTVAIYGATITMTLDAPLESLLGFEREPRTEAERNRVREMAQVLRSGDAFATTPAARCRPAKVELASAALAPELLGSGGGGAAGTTDDGRAELNGTFIYRCEDIAALREIDVRLFDPFKRLHRIDAQLAGPKGQSAHRLRPRARQLRW
jgi:hypothetical protein